MIVDKYGRVAGSINLAELAQMYAECDDDDLRDHYREVAAENGLDLETGEPLEPEPEAEPEAVEVEPDGTLSEPVEGDGSGEALPEVESHAPPRAGKGSGRDEWAAYAESQGVDVTDDMTRDEIIEATEE